MAGRNPRSRVVALAFITDECIEETERVIREQMPLCPICEGADFTFHPLAPSAVFPFAVVAAECERCGYLATFTTGTCQDAAVG